eukprot:NODE_1809_length_488_cov_407.086560_g1731_i0.p1 GENE.NODE_1809_length_488_cov_407.086560_g1731_i0~~NODE_1809_length_488_cov_407.086560_g1731_i0.p1  ORF type:complete len:77 (-),score=13.31 NODE_1809_length_488_cov_407.086560_g1731_i0:213-443(-)
MPTYGVVFGRHFGAPHIGSHPGKTANQCEELCTAEDLCAGFEMVGDHCYLLNKANHWPHGKEDKANVAIYTKLSPD